MRNTPIRFTIHRGDELIGEETLDQSIIKVGNLPSSHLRLEDDGVSRMHAVIEMHNGEATIVDLGSARGTEVNGKRVTKTVLKSGDAIQMGGLTVRVAIEAKPVARPVAPPPAIVAGPPPFAAPAPAPALAIVPTPVVADDMETLARATDVIVMWGDNPIHAEHISPPRAFTLGEAGKDVDFVMGSDLLGGERLPLVLESDGRTRVVVPAGATGFFSFNGQTKALTEIADRLTASSTVMGASELELPLGASARIEHRGLSFLVKTGHASKALAKNGKGDRRPLAFVAGSFVAHAVFLAMFSLLPPAAHALNLTEINRDSRLVDMLVNARATIEEDPPLFQDSGAQADSGGEPGAAAPGDEGQAGDESAPNVNGAYAVRHRSNDPPALPRAVSQEEMLDRSILGVLRAQTLAANVPTSPFGADQLNGVHDMDAIGALTGDHVAQSFGLGGLGMRGTGIGNNGTTGIMGIGNSHSTMGRGGDCDPRTGRCGTGPGQGDGNEYGRTAGHLAGREGRVPTLRIDPPTTVGSLSAETIRRVVRRHRNEIVGCYQAVLQSNPDIEGRVTVGFTISPAGAVSTALIANTTLRNNQVETCVQQAVRRFSFPQPEGGGVVTVTYPFVFAAQ